MSIDVAAEVEIARPRAEVAACMFDPSQDARWTTGVVEAKPLQDGLLRVGAKVDRVSKFLGRRLEYRIEVVAAEPERFVEMVATQPFEMRAAIIWAFGVMGEPSQAQACDMFIPMYNDLFEATEVK